MLRKEWEAEKEQMQLEEEELKAAAALPPMDDNVFRPISKQETTPAAVVVTIENEKSAAVPAPVEKGGKKKRRKKSVLKKKNQTNPIQRKNSSSSGSTEQNDFEATAASVADLTPKDASSSTDSSPPTENVEQALAEPETPNRILDIHFFSDTEAQTGPSPHRPSTPIQSDTEFEVSIREKTQDDSRMSNSASWKWGELPTQLDESGKDAKQTQRSMLGGMFSFMKQGRKMRKNAADGLYLEDLENEDIDPEVAALYFPPRDKQNAGNKTEEDRESGNGTSVPQSPTSMEGIKSLDSDYDDKQEKALDFVAISLCGPLEKGYPSDDEFRKNQVQFSDVSSPNSRNFFFIFLVFT